MTHEEIQNMPAGNKIDMLVELDVFGWPKGYDDARDIPPYSTDINAAWKVVEKLREDGLYLTMNADAFSAGYPQFNPGSGWWCSFKYSALAETAPLAICRAALLARGKQ